MIFFRLIASWSLRTKLWALIAVAVVAMLVIAVLAVSQINAVIQPNIATAIELLSTERAAALTVLTDSLAEQTRSIAQSVALQQAVAGNADTPDGIEATLTPLLAAAQANTSLIRQVRVVNRDGQVLGASPAVTDLDDRDAPYFAQLRDDLVSNNKVYAGPLEQGEAPLVNFIAELRNGQQALGYVVVSVDAAGNIGATGDKPSVSLLTAIQPADFSSGSVVAYFLKGGQEIKLESPLVTPSADAAVTTSMSRLIAIRVFTRSVRLDSPLTGQSALLIARPIRALDRWLVMEGRALQLGSTGEVNTLALTLVGIIALASLALFLIGLLIERTVVRPAQMLRAFTQQIAQQGAVNPLTLPQRDELGAIAANLNHVAAQTQANAANLQTRLDRNNRDTEAVRDIGQAMLRTGNLDDLLNVVVAMMTTRFPDIQHAQIFLRSDKAEQAMLRAASGEAGESLVRRGEFLHASLTDPASKTMIENQPSVARNAAVYSPAEVTGMQAQVALPLRREEAVIGVLNLYSARPDAFIDDDVQVLQGAADQLANAVNNITFVEQTFARLRETEAQNRQLLGDAWRTYSANRRRATAGDSAVEWSDLQLRAIRSGHLVEETGETLVTVAIPVSLRGVVLGAVECDIPRDRYSEGVRQLAMELTNRLALATDNARLFEQSVRAAEREVKINEISTKLTQQRDVAQVLQVAVRELGQALRVPGMSIRLGRTKPVSNDEQDNGLEDGS